MKSGLVILMSDFCSKWVDIAKNNKLDVLGLHANPTFTSVNDYLSWLKDENVSRNIDSLQNNGTIVEHYLHAVDWLLDRMLFSSHPEFFRMVKGKRVVDHNLCVSSLGLDIVSENAYKLAKKLNQTSHRYHIWADDGDNNACMCDRCASLSQADQVMMITNAIYKGIKAYDNKAKLSYLCYADAVSIPKVEKEEGIFLEFAPFYRKFDSPLGVGEKNTFYKNLLLDLLKIFKSEETEILDYWLDVSLFSDWKKENVRPLALNKNVLLQDINFYASLNLYAIKSFAAFIDQDYLNKFSSQPINFFCQCLNSYE